MSGCDVWISAPEIIALLLFRLPKTKHTVMLFSVSFMGDDALMLQSMRKQRCCVPDRLFYAPGS